MIIKTEGKLGEGMSYKSLLFGELRSGGGTYWDVFSILEKREKFLRSLSSAQAQRIFNAVLEGSFKAPR